LDTIAAIARAERRHPGERPRRPEPMAMDAAESVRAFHDGGGSASSMRAVYGLCARALDVLVPEGGRLLDLGVGSGRGLARFLVRRPDVTATGVDLAPNMLAEARTLLEAEGLGGRAELVQADVRALPTELRERRWDAVCSVWALHHLPDREALNAALRQIGSLRERSDAAVWLLDFQRLRAPDSFNALLALLQPQMPAALRSDALRSEAAAFTHEELRLALGATGLGDLKDGLVEPIPWLQAFWTGGQAVADEEHDALSRSFSKLPF
jgi:SAM-dependent methyltransferase